MVYGEEGCEWAEEAGQEGCEVRCMGDCEWVKSINYEERFCACWQMC